MAVRRQEGRWLHLPSNVWAATFCINRPCNVTQSWIGHSFKTQAGFLKLRTVCQTFNKIFQQNDHFSSSVVVGKQAPSCQLPSLVKWLRCLQACVKQLVVENSSPWPEIVITALQSPNPVLEDLQLSSGVPDAAMFLLSTFQSVTTCTLQHAHTSGSLDLRPLSSLPLLTELNLVSGQFVGLEAAAHLTALSVNGADAVCMQDCSCVTSLVELDLWSCQLLRFHPRNVFACSRLESLMLVLAEIGGHELDEEYLFPGHIHGSGLSGLSALTALTNLVLQYSTHDMQLDWVTTLSALQSLKVEAFQAVFPASWSTMTSLKSLDIEIDPNDDTRGCNLFFFFDLGTLASLQSFELSFVTMSAEKLSGLASLSNLQEVIFKSVESFGKATATEIGLLAFDLGRKRQDVQFRMFSTI